MYTYTYTCNIIYIGMSCTNLVKTEENLFAQLKHVCTCTCLLFPSLSLHLIALKIDLDLGFILSHFD